jgi:hypothetical protein
MADDPIESALGVRAGILNELINLAGKGAPPKIMEVYRIQARDLVEKLKTNDIMLSSVTSSRSSMFSKCESHIQAIEMFLADAKTPVPREEIAIGVKNGGYLGGTDRAATLIRKSLSNFLTGTGSKTKGHIKEINDLVGLDSWDDRRFKKSR